MLLANVTNGAWGKNRGLYVGGWAVEGGDAYDAEAFGIACFLALEVVAVDTGQCSAANEEAACELGEGAPAGDGPALPRAEFVEYCGALVGGDRHGRGLCRGR